VVRGESQGGQGDQPELALGIVSCTRVKLPRVKRQCPYSVPLNPSGSRLQAHCLDPGSRCSWQAPTPRSQLRNRQSVSADRLVEWLPCIMRSRLLEFTLRYSSPKELNCMWALWHIASLMLAFDTLDKFYFQWLHRPALIPVLFRDASALLGLCEPRVLTIFWRPGGFDRREIDPQTATARALLSTCYESCAFALRESESLYNVGVVGIYQSLPPEGHTTC
jgi:hypothetical protein